MRRDPPAAISRPILGNRASRSAVGLALLLCACWYPKERGERVEQRLDRMEAEGPVRQADDGAAAREQSQRVDAKLGEVQARLNELGAVAQGGGERGARYDKLAEELARLRAMVEQQGLRLDAIERTHASARSSAGERAAPPAPAPTPKKKAEKGAARSPVPADKTGLLASAREQEDKGEKVVARELYQEYVTQFPADPSAAEAHFRLGEMAFGERRYRDAIVAYGRVAKDFPSSERAPDALLRTAESMLQIQLKEEAVTVLSEIPKRYPASAAATRAKQRLGELEKTDRGGSKRK